jgi:hypothetical protein
MATTRCTVAPMSSLPEPKFRARHWPAMAIISSNAVTSFIFPGPGDLGRRLTEGRAACQFTVNFTLSAPPLALALAARCLLVRACYCGLGRLASGSAAL